MSDTLKEQLAFREYRWAHPYKTEKELKQWWEETKKTSLQDLVAYYSRANQLITLLKSHRKDGKRLAYVPEDFTIDINEWSDATAKQLLSQIEEL